MDRGAPLGRHGASMSDLVLGCATLSDPSNDTAIVHHDVVVGLDGLPIDQRRIRLVRVPVATHAELETAGLLAISENGLIVLVEDCGLNPASSVRLRHAAQKINISPARNFINLAVIGDATGESGTPWPKSKCYEVVASIADSLVLVL